ncbi:non-ribosomal peptide synthetase [Kribbella voronezhensis]|uniref:non-ribosomal peptide synthetase n=1 Tax=Kribbella voronezhensis TaxID=2512212 RepID=UPI001417008A|nr:FkbM family methyltransferase [Kribbella voronezhensis]
MEWLAHVRGAIAEADEVFAGFAPEDVELLLGQESDGGRRRLFSVLVAPREIELVGRTFGNDLTVGIGPGGLHVVFDERLFDPEILRAWMEDTTTLMDALQHGRGVVNEILAAATADRAGRDQARTVALYAAPSVATSIMSAAAHWPDAPAVVTANCSVSYEQLRQRYLAVAQALQAEGVVSGDAVGILVTAGPSFVAGLLGTIHLGAVPVPLDAQSPAPRLALAAGVAGFDILLADDARTAKALQVCASTTGSPPRVVDVDRAQEMPETTDPKLSAPAAVEPDAPGYILFTSGSTGRPKGVVQTRRTLDSVVDWQVRRSGVATRPRTLQRSALSFDVALQEILSTLADGGTLLVPADWQRQDLSLVARLIHEWQVERLFIPPSGLHAMLAAADASLLSSLREVICAGEPLIITGTVRRVFREINSGLDNQYGPTETHVCTAMSVGGDPFTWPDNPSIGTPVPGVGARVVDTLGRHVTLGTPGELVISGQTVALGYLDAPSLKFADEPRHDGNGAVRSYRTGDFVKERPDGSFEFLSRQDEQLKVRGYRVELGEVEAAALATELVTDAVAFGLGDSSAVERLGLVVVPFEPTPDFDKASLLEQMALRLPPYMMPRPAETMVREGLELTPTGKVDRRQVAQLGEMTFRERSANAGSGDERIRSLWHRCLGVDECDEDETFVALGGDSLAAVELTAALQDAVGVNVSLRQLLAGMTLRTLRSVATGELRSPDTSQQPGVTSSDRNAVPSTVDLPKFGRIACVSPAEAKHLYLDVVVSNNYGRFGMLDGPIEVVVDVGANIGLFALSVLDRHPEARVIAVEPHPAFAQALRANTADRVSVVEAAAAQTRGEAPLFIYDQMPAMSSLNPEPDYDRQLMASLIDNQLNRVGAGVATAPAIGLVGENPVAHPVQTVRLSDLLADHNCTSVSLLKVDVQHGELDVLLGLDDGDWTRIERIVVEVQDRDKQLDDLQQLLSMHGFSTSVHFDAILHAGSRVRFLYAWAPSQQKSAV